MNVTTALNAYWDAEEPAVKQPNDWSCSVVSLYWMLKAFGRQPHLEWLIGELRAQNRVSPKNGLENANGSGLAAFINETYGESLRAINFSAVSWEALPDIMNAGTGYRILLGGRAWNHWVAVRDWPNDMLLMNPAPGFKGVDQVLSYQDFQRLGPFAAVAVEDLRPKATLPPLATTNEIALTALLDVATARGDKYADALDQIAAIVRRVRA